MGNNLNEKLGIEDTNGGHLMVFDTLLYPGEHAFERIQRRIFNLAVISERLSRSR